MESESGVPFCGNAAEVATATRGWFLGHFIEAGRRQHSEELELKWFTHARGETRSDWSPASPVRTLNLLVRGRFVLLFPDREVCLAREGDFVLFGPGVPHSYRSEEESVVLTVRWPSRPPR